MIENRGNDEKTISDGDKDMILVECYHILRQLGHLIAESWAEKDREKNYHRR